jgi:DNA-binding transcriptional ArsR family regulator/rhodanese-related sulfurtransferase
MGARPLKDAVYAEFAVVGKALSAPKRLELLELLAQCPRTVESLATETDASIANASQHLKILRNARLVTSEKRGLNVQYRLAGQDVADAVLGLRRFAESHYHQMIETKRLYLQARHQLEAVTSDELVSRIREGSVTLLDVRPTEEYDAGHVKGALNVPVEELGKRLQQLKKRTEIVAYCRGPYCVMALDAVHLLKKRGFRAHALDLGVVEMRSLGLPVISSGARP